AIPEGKRAVRTWSGRSFFSRWRGHRRFLALRRPRSLEVCTRAGDEEGTKGKKEGLGPNHSRSIAHEPALRKALGNSCAFRDPFAWLRTAAIGLFCGTFPSAMMKSVALTPGFVAPALGSTTCDLEALFVEHSDFIFRTCRQLGLERAAAEDATQQVFMIAA